MDDDSGSAPDDDLVTSEGVDEASADSTAEAPGHQKDGAGLVEGDGEAKVEGRVGPGPAKPPDPPLDMESTESREAKADHGTGQQLAEGEG